MKSMVLCGLLGLSAVAGAAAAARSRKSNMQRMSEITRVLASDEFQGRAPGTPGEDKTIPYLIEQFKAAGLEPAGENGGWTQTVPMIRTQLKAPVNVSVSQAGRRCRCAFPTTSISARCGRSTACAIANAPMVFVGYGVTAPERGWDDFKGVDLKGKVAVMLVNDPDFEAAAGEPVAGKFGGKTMTFYGRWVYKYEEAARRGAIAALVVHETEAAGYPWTVVKSPAGESYNVVLPAGAQQPVLLQGWIQQSRRGGRCSSARAMIMTTVKRAGADARRSGRSTSRRRFSADIPVTLARITSHNVLGKLTGSKYPNETVSYGGHWDAYGIGPAGRAGADDPAGRRRRRARPCGDARGCAAVRRRAAAAADARVRRVDGRGARAARLRILCAAPAVPDGDDGRQPDLRHAAVERAGQGRGAGRASGQSGDMERCLADAAKAQGRYVTAENHPERGLFYRADHFSFAKRGVPVLLDMALAGRLRHGRRRPAGGRAAGSMRFTATCYHQTCDAWAPSWDLRGAAQEAELFYAIGARLANSRDWPQWNATLGVREGAGAERGGAGRVGHARSKGERGR